MKILFLDIDGVLNRVGREGTTERCCGFIGVDRALAKKLTDWLITTDVKIVLSSTWRKHPEMWPHLNEAGITWISMTPDMSKLRQSGVWIAKCRGDEIQHWLNENFDKVTAYAILDDDSDMLPTQVERFVQTHTGSGIQDQHIEKLKELFA